MWNVGFRRYLKEILNYFLGQCKYAWKTKEGQYLFEIFEQDEKVSIRLHETIQGETHVYQEQHTFDELYKIIVPTNRLEYLYLFQDLLNEREEEDAKEIVIQAKLREILIPMSRVFMSRKEKMEKVEEPSIEEIKVVPGKRFEVFGVEYEQLALAI